ncbi:MAG TPA: hypothetical protein GX505_00405 [Clostridiales bacterium]|nr:hypothetical protein [Clostridiales bacterium]
MNKRKKFLVFLIAVFLLLAIPCLLLILKKPIPAASILKASSEDDVYQFYYRSVPGLKMAEDTGMVKDLNKRLEWPGRDSVVIIDRIWYSTKSVYLFYHVENMTEAAYLGGEIYLPSSEPARKQSFHGLDSIGRASEKGILFNDSYYSCLKLPPLRDNSGNIISGIETLAYAPFINVPDRKDKDSFTAVRLKAFDIGLNYLANEEPVTKIPVQAMIDINDKQLSFYQVNISPSVLQIYFQYLNSGKDRVYRVKGTYTTDKGETYEFDAYPRAITDYPYHYSMDVPPLHIIPSSLQIQIDSIYCTGSDSISFDINTRQYDGKSKSYKVEIGKDQVKGTDILVEEILLNKQSAEIFIAAKPAAGKPAPYTRIDLSNPQWYREELDIKEEANILTIKNADYQLYNPDKLAYGIKVKPEKGIYIDLERDFWDSTGIIRIEIDNLRYVYEIGMKAVITLDNQPDSD